MIAARRSLLFAANANKQRPAKGIGILFAIRCTLISVDLRNDNVE
jgi:hypothetical protein